MKPAAPRPSLQDELLDAAVAVLAAVLLFVPITWFIDWMPLSWLRVFDVFGRSLQPWLLSAAVAALVVPPYCLLTIALSWALRLGKPRSKA